MNSEQQKRESQLKHAHEYKTEILAPIYWFIAITIGGTLSVVLYAFLSGGNPSNAADISLIWLTLVLIVVGLIVLAGLVFAIVGMDELDRSVDKYAGYTQIKIEKINQTIRKTNENLTAPLRKIFQFMERFRGE